MSDQPKIAVFSGPTATIQNTAPLLTANGGGGPLRAQRLAAPTVVYVSQFSGHPLEADSAELYAPPDGWLDGDGEFQPIGDGDLPDGEAGVYRVELKPEDGPLLLPYAARTRDGDAWTSGGLTAMAPETETRQTFFPDASGLYEEIDRFGVDSEGQSGLLSSLAEFEFVRAAPSGGYRRDGEVHGRDFFFYWPPHLRREPRPEALVRATNVVQSTLATGQFVGAQWLEGSPTNEESLYWFNLLIDTTVPLVGHSAQRQHGTVSADGDKNIWDGVRYLTSRVWADEDGRNRIGVVMIVDEVVYTAREVAKTDARPGNYIAAGGHGGVVGSVGGSGAPKLTFVPVRKHTYQSDVRLSQLPAEVSGVQVEADGSLSTVPVAVLGPSGELAPAAFPAVELVKFGRYAHECCGEVEVESWLAHALGAHPLAGFVGEGKSPYGSMDPSQEVALKRAAFSGLPVVKAGRGNTGGFTYEQPPWFIKAGNLTATKARILLMASLLKLGALPPAADPGNPTPEEMTATFAAVERYQEIFDTH